jgi:hypothetical protein
MLCNQQRCLSMPRVPGRVLQGSTGEYGESTGMLPTSPAVSKSTTTGSSSHRQRDSLLTGFDTAEFGCCDICLVVVSLSLDCCLSKRMLILSNHSSQGTHYSTASGQQSNAGKLAMVKPPRGTLQGTCKTTQLCRHLQGMQLRMTTPAVPYRPVVCIRSRAHHSEGVVV